MTVEAAEAGAHVLCEKPLDVYADRMDRMITACDRAGVTLAGVFQRRFQPAVRRAKRAVETGELGELVVADAATKWFRSDEYYERGGWRGTRDMDGGVMLNQAVHDIDCLQWLLGGVDEVRASLGYRHRDIECESAAVLSLRTETGAVGSVSATTATKGGRYRIDLNGTEGSLGLSDTGISYFETGTGEESYYSAETESRDVDEEALEGAERHAAVVRDFVDALREGREPAVLGRAARSTVDVVLAAYASDERGEAVSVADVRAGQVPEARSGSGEAGPGSE